MKYLAYGSLIAWLSVAVCTALAYVAWGAQGHSTEHGRVVQVLLIATFVGWAMPLMLGLACDD